MQIGVTVKNFPNPDRAVGGRCCISLLVKILQIHHAFNPPPQLPHSTRSFKNTLLKESTNSHGCVFLFVQSNLSVSDSLCWCLFYQKSQKLQIFDISICFQMSKPFRCKIAAMWMACVSANVSVKKVLCVQLFHYFLHGVFCKADISWGGEIMQI